jgi:hypothetical protein
MQALVTISQLSLRDLHTWSTLPGMYRLAALFLVIFLIPSLGTADTLYKWVDDQGNVHYSDKPAPGATKINIPKAPTFTPPQAAQPTDGSATARQQGKRQGFAGYTAMVINSPQDQATFWDVTSVNVSVGLTPNLQSGDRVTIAVDGATQTVSGTSASFDNLDRGEHTVTASIVSGKGNTVNAKPVTFYIQRAIAKRPP